MPYDPETGKRTRGRPSKEETAAKKARHKAAEAVEPFGTFELPYGYRVEVYSARELMDVERDAQPFIDHKDRVRLDQWPQIQHYLLQLLQLSRLDAEIARQQNAEEKDHELIELLMKRSKDIQATITTIRTKLDPLNQEKAEETTLAKVLQEAEAESVRYAEEHIGEFTWQCPHCARFNICEVPHFAYDSAFGPKVIWNKPAFESVRRFFGYRKKVDNYIRRAPAEIRRMLTDPRHDLHRLLFKEAGGLTLIEAAALLNTSPIGMLAIARERGFDFGFPYDLNKFDTLAPYVMTEEDYADFLARREMALNQETVCAPALNPEG